MESRNPRLSICYFGSKDEREKVLSLAQEKFANYDVQLFASIGEDRYLELWRSSLLKRNFEIANYFEFDVCVGVYADKFRSFDYVNIKELQPSRAYYISGYYHAVKHVTGANFGIFFSKSIEFDRIAEFFHSRQFIKTGNNKEAEQFLYHIKTLDFDAECINLENSSLFIRSA